MHKDCLNLSIFSHGKAVGGIATDHFAILAPVQKQVAFIGSGCQRARKARHGQQCDDRSTIISTLPLDRTTLLGIGNSCDSARCRGNRAVDIKLLLEIGIETSFMVYQNTVVKLNVERTLACACARNPGQRNSASRCDFTGKRCRRTAFHRKLFGITITIVYNQVIATPTIAV